MAQKLWCIFIAAGFAPASRERAQLLAALLNEAGFDCVIGEGFGGTRISDGVRKRIASADIVIAVIEPTEGEREPSQWIVQEIAYAAALKKTCLLLVQKDVHFAEGILGDVEFINFEVSNYAAALPQVLRQLNVMLRNRGLAIGIKEVPASRLYISEGPSENDCNEMARAYLKTASVLTEKGDYNGALKYAEKATTVDKACYQARIKYGGLLLKSGRLGEATRIHLQVLKDFKDNRKACAAAKHNLAVTKELQFGPTSVRANTEAMPLYECSLSLDPSREYTRAALICTYLRLAKPEKAYTLLEESLKCENFILAMRRELDENMDGLKLLVLLPTWAQNLLYPLQQGGDWE